MSEPRDLADHCEEAERIVSSWPEWKRNCLTFWSDDSKGSHMKFKTKPEPGPFVCAQCGRHESEPVGIGDACYCGGSFAAVQYGWLCSVDNDRFEPMDYGEIHIEGVDEPSQTSLLRRGARMAAFDSKEIAMEALQKTGKWMRANGSDAFQRAVFCLVRIIARDPR